MEDVQPQSINPDPRQASIAQAKFVLTARARSGTDWFFWIAALSLINSIAALVGASFSFLAGLGITQIIDAFASALGEKASDAGMVIHILGFLINLAIASIFLLAGFLARKRHRWIVVAGMMFYALDALLLLLFQSWFSALFHGWALWGLWNGLKALNALKKLEESA